MDGPQFRGAASAAPLTRCLKDGGKSFEALAETGEWVVVHPGLDPHADARQRVFGVSVPAPRAVVILAAGLGYLVEAAAARWPTAHLVVIEPDASVAAAARRRLPATYAAERTRLLVGPDYAGAEELWRVFDDTDGVETPPIFADPVLALAWPTQLRVAAQVAGRAVAAARMNGEARARHAGPYLLNTLRNARHLVRGPNPAALAGGFDDVPAVVVGAGPSLTGLAPRLRELAGRALVIAVDTSWRPLVAAGVHPHLVVAVDPSAENGRHLQDVHGATETWILAEASVDPPSLALLAGRVAAFRVAAHQPWPWLIGQGFDTLTLRAWGSVLTTAFDLALVCGCAPIVFIGADLAFSDGRPYCRGTTIEDEWARHAAHGVSLREIWANTIASRPVVSVPSVTGGAVQTAPHLVEFRDWIAARAADTTPGRVMNASGTGILHGTGITQATLEQALLPHPLCADRVRETLADALGRRPEPARAAVIAGALRAVASSEEDTAGTITAWVAAGRPTLTPEAVRSALLEGANAIEAPSPAPSNPRLVPPPRWFAADRVAEMRARLTGERTAQGGLDRPTPRPPEEAARVARYAAESLLAMPILVTGIGPDVSAGTAPDRVPLSQRFAWTSEAAPFVAALEEALLDSASVAAIEVEGADAWRVNVTPARSAPTDGVGAPDVQARAAAAAMQVTVLAGARHIRCERDHRLLTVAARALVVPALASSGPARVDLHLCDGVLRLPLVPEAFLRAVTGTVVEACDGDAPATAFLRHIICEIAPEVLSGGDVPRGWSVVTASETRAHFVPAGAAHSLAIGPDGPPEAATSWPGPITGEIPWGSAGGGLAWNPKTHDVYWRRSGAASVATTRTPFTPKHVVWTSGGTAVWADTDGRLWQWLPGEPARLMATLAEGGIPRCDHDVLVVAPMPRDADGRPRRARTAVEWCVDPRTGEVSTQPCGIEGQCAKVASSGGWSAATHPYADTVRLTTPDGRGFWLACDTPLGVAWAGASLVVTLATGDLLRFPHLRTRLAERLAGASLAP